MQWFWIFSVGCHVYAGSHGRNYGDLAPNVSRYPSVRMGKVGKTSFLPRKHLLHSPEHYWRWGLSSIIFSEAPQERWKRSIFVPTCPPKRNQRYMGPWTTLTA